MSSDTSAASRIFVAGHRGLVGSAIVRAMESKGHQHLITRTHAELDLMDHAAVSRFFDQEKPDCVVLAAAKVGGIQANDSYPAEFIHQNLAIQTNVIHEAWRHGVKRLLFLGSSCIYPRDCPQPMAEEYLLTGPLESTNRPYAVAKIAGIEMCWSYNRQYGTQYLAVMPTNLFGPGDNYDLKTSHVLPALIRKFHEAKVAKKSTATVWGTGKPRREFLHCDDLAGACVFLLGLADTQFAELLSGNASAPLINIGYGKDLTISELALMVKDIVGFAGDLAWDHDKPDGTPQKLLDVSKIEKLGWSPRIPLRAGVAHAYQAFQKSAWAIDSSPQSAMTQE